MIRSFEDSRMGCELVKMLNLQLRLVSWPLPVAIATAELLAGYGDLAVLDIPDKNGALDGSNANLTVLALVYVHLQSDE